jgi:pyridoxine 5-phosphate synthase
MIELGVNIDHVASVRQARRTYEPDPVWAAVEAHLGGADGITVHLREDRRHINDDDVRRLRELTHVKLNLEMAATDEMVGIACALRPEMAMLVPEGRHEVTTEGGLDVAGLHNVLAPMVARLKAVGIRVSLFVDADAHQLEAAARLGADIVELHTGAYAHGGETGDAVELARLVDGARLAHSLGLEVHAGHGLTFANVGPVAAIAEVVELNIGHFLIGQAVFDGLGPVVRRMRALMDAARSV